MEYIVIGLTELLVLLICVFLAFMVHEMGHCIAGRRQGYTLLYIELFGVCFCNRAGKLSLEHHRNMPFGQCVMRPPSPDADAKPLVLGGCIANYAAAVAGLMMTVPFLADIRDNFIAHLPILSIGAGLAVANFALGLSNYLGKSKTCDGNTYHDICVSPAHNRVYNQIMEISSLAFGGMPFGSMPAELFEDGTNYTNSLTAELELYAYYRMIELTGFDDVKKIAADLDAIKYVKDLGFDDEYAREKGILMLAMGDTGISEAELDVLDSDYDARAMIARNIRIARAHRYSEIDRRMYRKMVDGAVYPGEWKSALTTTMNILKGMQEEEK